MQKIHLRLWSLSVSHSCLGHRIDSVLLTCWASCSRVRNIKSCLIVGSKRPLLAWLLFLYTPLLFAQSLIENREVFSPRMAERCMQLNLSYLIVYFKSQLNIGEPHSFVSTKQLSFMAWWSCAIGLWVCLNNKIFLIVKHFANMYYKSQLNKRLGAIEKHNPFQFS